MSKFDEIYANATYEVRLKAKIFQPVLYIIFSAFVLFGLSTVLFGKITFTLVLLVLIALILGASIYLLRIGKYETAVLLSTFSMLFLMMANRAVVIYEGPQTVPQSAFTLTVILLVMAVFTSRRRWTLAGGIILFLFSAIMLAVGVFSGKMPAEMIGTLGVAPLLLIILATSLGVTVQVLFSRVSQDLFTQLDQARAAQEKSQKVINEVSLQLDMSDRLTQASEETAASGFEIERNVHSIKDQIVQLNSSFSNTETALGNISQNLGQLGSLAEKQSDSVSHSGSAVEQMVASIQSVSSIIDGRTAEVRVLRNTAQDGQKAIAETSESFKIVVQQIESIKQMTKLITGIAAQTNLLAMNAAIEAAHAGDAGRGFSVVADEIRKLADASRQSAGTIGTSLKDLTKAIDLTDQRVKASGAAFGQVQASVEKVSSAMEEIGASTHEMNTGTDEILRSTADLQGATQGVEASVKQVADAYQQILSDVKQVARIISEVASGMDEIGVGATDIRQAVSSLTTLSAELKEQTSLLQKAAV